MTKKQWENIYEAVSIILLTGFRVSIFLWIFFTYHHVHGLRISAMHQQDKLQTLDNRLKDVHYKVMMLENASKATCK